MTVTYQKTSNHNTNYYRRNKLEKFNVHTCPHCNYETTGPKSSLQAHIWSKHTPENLKPFQCPCFKSSLRTIRGRYFLKLMFIKMRG